MRDLYKGDHDPFTYDIDPVVRHKEERCLVSRKASCQYSKPVSRLFGFKGWDIMPVWDEKIPKSWKALLKFIGERSKEILQQSKAKDHEAMLQSMEAISQSALPAVSNQDSPWQRDSLITQQFGVNGNPKYEFAPKGRGSKVIDLDGAECIVFLISGSFRLDDESEDRVTEGVGYYISNSKELTLYDGTHVVIISGYS